MPRDTWTAPATLPLFSTSVASRTSTTNVSPLAIISRACAGVTRGTAALAASIICLTLLAMSFSFVYLGYHDPRPSGAGGKEPQHQPFSLESGYAPPVNGGCHRGTVDRGCRAAGE